MKERRKKPLDFCSVHDTLLRQALNAPTEELRAYEFRVRFQAQRLKDGVIVKAISIDRVS
jgi:hypothetical protein